MIEAGMITALFAVGLAIRAIDLTKLAVYPDELTYTVRATQIIAANWAWPSTQMWDQPPLFTYIVAVVIAGFGGTLESLRSISVIFGASTIFVAYLLGKSMYGKVAGVLAATGVTFDGFHILYSRLLYIEALANVMILGSILLFWEGIVKRRSTKVSVLGGIVFGLALDSKYIAMVAGVAMFLFLFLYWNKFGGKFPFKQVFLFFSTSVMMFVPVLLDLYVNNANPFYFDLVERFQQSHVNSLAVSIRSGSLFALGFQRFVQVQFHVSSIDPYGVFPLFPFQVIAWAGIVAVVLTFFIFSFLKRSVPDGLLLILFLALLAFAFEYPGKRVYFSLYPSMIFMVMMGRVGQLAVQGIRRDRVRLRVIPTVSLAVITLILMGLVINMAAVPTVYQSGFGDWDELIPITNYISANHNTNTSVASDLAVLDFYILENHVNVQLISMRLPEEYYNEPVVNQTLMVPLKGEYPLYYVLSTTQIERVKPQYIIIPSLDYASTSTDFHAFINERYFQPLNTKLILLFEIRPGNQSGSNLTGCC